jgi:hypothetical protein
MRKLYLFPAFLLGILVVFQSCSKRSATEAMAPVNPNIINATIALNGSYQLPVDNSGTISISKQASHFQVSQTGTDSKTGAVVYKYVPAVDYTGTDEVILSNTKTRLVTGSGCPNNHTSNGEATTATTTTFTTIKISVTSN